VISNKSDLSILVVDDEPYILGMAVHILNQLGHEQIETASNGNSALSKLTANDAPFDIIICDLNMPEMDGLEFMRSANDSGFEGGMILLSGENKRTLETALSLVKSHNVNLLGGLVKPIKHDALEGLLEGFEPKTNEIRSYTPQKPITEEDLVDGIRGSSINEVNLVFQPKISVKTGEITGVETLARWWSAERGVLGPDTFIPLAEATGLIDALTNKIYLKAIIQASEWAKQGRNLKTAVNISVNSFSKPEFCNFLVETVQSHGVNSSRIILEVTETQAMTVEIDCLEALMRLRLKRFGLSIDDFGTGSSSLAQLKNIPFTEMKIDRAFVNGAAHDDGALAILETSVNLAKKLDMEIVAEGAETREDWDLVEQLGCDYVQGFYCARPMPNDNLIEFMDNWTGPH